MSDALLRPAASAESGSGRTRVRCEAYDVGGDLLVVLGGDGAHLGAASLAERRPEDATVRSGTLGALSHREPDLLAGLSCLLVEATGRRVVVTGGIHIDDAAPEEIDRILSSARQAVLRVGEALSAPDRPGTGSGGGAA